MGATLERKLQVEIRNADDPASFRYYSQRLVRDLEAKGILRTVVETTNLAIHVNKMDILAAECIRTFPTVTFPANLLLKREEIETGKVRGASVVAALHAAGSAFTRRAYIEAPFDLMYGFRGVQRDLALLSPFEMIMQYSMEEVKPPNSTETNPNAILTDKGLLYKEQCLKAGRHPQYEASVHYEVQPSGNRISLPGIDALRILRHRWFWERRPRPHVPVWSFSKIPRSNIAPEENARLLSVYMRPWTLNSDNATEHTPLLLNLCKVSQDVVAKPIPIVASDPKPLRRIRGKQNVGHETTAKLPVQSIASSYSITWNHYIHGHVVSRSSRRFIMNLLSATAARVIERHESSDEDSDVSDIERCKTHAGSLDLIHETLQGIAAKDEENGALSFGRHATSIKMGRDM